MIRLNYTYSIFFTTELAGVATAADTTPTATLYRNGSASGVTVTVATTATTGLYKATFTTDAGWAATDVLHLVSSASINSTGGYVAVVWDSTGASVVVNDPTAEEIAGAVWDYLQTETTESASMKEALEITLRNAKLIPAAI